VEAKGRFAKLCHVASVPSWVGGETGVDCSTFAKAKHREAKTLWVGEKWDDM